MARLLILTGASGAGKTTLAKLFESRHSDLAEVFGFDSVGVPSVQEMVEVHGSGENWQRDTMQEWAKRIAPLVARGRNVLLEGQVRLSFIDSACEQIGIGDYRTALVDCSDRIRHDRLTRDRAQPELANPDMMRWAAFLRANAATRGDPIIHTDCLSIAASVESIRQLFPN